jgi:hypothetical protein
MRRIVPVALLALALASLPVARLHAWGFNGHKFIADRAIELLPQEIRPFFQKYRTTIVEHAIDPDTYRTVGWAEEPPRHFLDMDSYGPFPFKELPHDYNAAVAARGAAFVIKNGLLPWRTQEMYDQLRDSFRQLPTSGYARDNVKLFSSVIAHYTADAFQPFHAAANYDGQLTGRAVRSHAAGAASLRCATRPRRQRARVHLHHADRQLLQRPAHPRRRSRRHAGARVLR